MVVICKFVVCLFLSLGFFPLHAFAAEVLQVRSSSILQIGDRNRILTVKLACTDVDPANENNAVNLLRSELKRSEKVNLRPQGSKNGVLLSKVFIVESQEDIEKILFRAGLATFNC